MVICESCGAIETTKSSEDERVFLVMFGPTFLGSFVIFSRSYFS